jgi:hypothetical protein
MARASINELEWNPSTRTSPSVALLPLRGHREAAGEIRQQPGRPNIMVSGMLQLVVASVSCMHALHRKIQKSDSIL